MRVFSTPAASVLRIACLASALFVFSTAFADVTIKMEMTMKGGPQAIPAQNSTTWIKGNLSKVESQMFTMIIDAKKKTMTTLFPSTKTYKVAPMEKQSPQINVALKGTVKPTNETKTILGMKAKRYLVDASMTMGKDSQNQFKMSMDIWATEQVSVPKEMMAMGGDFLSGMGMSMNNPNFAAFKKEMEKIKGLALLTTATMQMPGTSRSAQPFSMTMKVTSVDKKTIPANVFQIPKGYKLAA